MGDRRREKRNDTQSEQKRAIQKRINVSDKKRKCEAQILLEKYLQTWKHITREDERSMKIPQKTTKKNQKTLAPEQTDRNDIKGK